MTEFKTKAQQRKELADLISEKQTALEGCINTLKNESDPLILEFKLKLEPEIADLKRKLDLLYDDLK